MRQKKGALHYVTIVFLIVIFLIVAICIGKTGEVQRHIAETNSFGAYEDFCKRQSDIIRDTSEYLTEQSKGYVFLEDKEYLDRYQKEIEEVKCRERALNQLSKFGLTTEELIPAEDAKRDSDYLAERETWAMRMVAEANGMKEADMPLFMQRVSLSDEERQMPGFLKKKTAQNYMIGLEYGKWKTLIDESLRKFVDQVMEKGDINAAESDLKIKDALYKIQFYNILLVVIVSLEVILFYAKVIVPFLRYSRELEKLNPDSGLVLDPCGFREMKLFANIFNHTYTDLLCKQKKLELLSTTDILTGIANRAALEDYVKAIIDEGEADIGFLMMDVDNFKLFNDGYGHLVGDQVLIQMASCFQKIASAQGGIAGRLGGEEFIIAVPNAKVDEIESMAASILDATLKIDIKELGIAEGGIRVTVSVGSTIWLKGKRGDLKSMIRQADMALYQAKSRGKNQHVMYSEEEALYKRLESEKIRQLEVESDVHRALEEEEFIPFFQPKYDMETGRICGAEALVRWAHIDKGFLYPDYFVPVLEKDGFITKIDFAMFEKICACIREWQDKNLPLVPIACNFSRLNFGKRTIVKELIAITERYGVSPSLIQVELTENSLLEKEAIVKMREELEELHTAGFSIAIDDFGTGYSSLGMLHELPADVLKVDKSFLHRDLTLKANELLLKGILYIAEIMKLQTIVEGVETKEQVDLLKGLGFRYVQGFYFSKPIKKTEYETIMKNQGEI